MGVHWWLVDRATRQRVVGQLPNGTIQAFLGLTVVRRIVSDSASGWKTGLSVASRAALDWWAVGELVRGVNPLRRALGGLTLARVFRRPLARLG